MHEHDGPSGDRVGIRLLAPGTTREWFCGGLVTIQRLAQVLTPVRRATVVTYQQREPGLPFLDDLLADPATAADLFVVAWGPDVERLVARLEGRRVCYWANSFGWGYRPPPGVPILSASRFTMGLWAEDAPSSPLFYLPNPLGPEFRDTGRARDIDVLHVGRKSSDYVRTALLPALSDVCDVVDVQEFVPDLAEMFNRAKVYVYDSRDYWIGQGVSEGFGLQPLEAMACGCTVFTSVNAGLSDFIDPGVNAEKIGVHSVANDVARVLERLRNPLPAEPDIVASYRPPAIRARWLRLEPALLDHFQRTLGSRTDISYRRLNGGRKYVAHRPPVGRRAIHRARRMATTISARRP
jgi:hypothetical protein